MAVNSAKVAFYAKRNAWQVKAKTDIIKPLTQLVEGLIF